MTARTVITAIMEEAGKDVPGLTWGIGHREAAAHHSPPRVDWLPERGAHRGPQQAGHNPRPIANRWVQFAVRCWGANHDATEALLSAVVRAAHLTLTRGGYELGGEEWLEVGVVSLGDAVVLTLTLGLPILDRAVPTARPSTIVTPGDLT